MKIAIFNIDSQTEINEFIAGVDVVENGIHLRENRMVIYYLEKQTSDSLTPAEQGELLKSQLRKAEGELLGAKLEQMFWDFKLKVTLPGDNAVEIRDGVRKSTNTVKSLTEQISNIKAFIARTTSGESIL